MVSEFSERVARLSNEGKTSDVRMAQYESESRVPKHDLVKEMAGIFDVSTHALTVPDIDTYIGLMHTFFALEDMYGLKIDEMDGEVVLRLDKSDYSTYSSMDKMLRAWLAEAKKLENGESTKEEYDDWRYFSIELELYTGILKIFLHRKNQGFVLIVACKFQCGKIRQPGNMVDKPLEIQFHFQCTVPVFECKHGAPVQPEGRVKDFLIKHILNGLVIEILIFCHEQFHDFHAAFLA